MHETRPSWSNQRILFKDEGQLEEARTLFKQIAEDYPNFGRVDEAAYYYGICYYLEADCASALPAFDDLIAAWPQSPWAVDARLHIDRCTQE